MTTAARVGAVAAESGPRRAAHDPDREATTVGVLFMALVVGLLDHAIARARHYLTIQIEKVSTIRVVRTKSAL